MAGCMDGTVLPTTIILPGKGVKKLKCNLPDNIYIIYSGNDNSWVDRGIISKWIGLVVAKYARKLPQGTRGLIFTDNHSSHTRPENIKKLQDLGFDVMFLPPNLTGELQPMDLTINKAIKERYSALWEEWFDKYGSTQSTEKAGNFVAPTKEKFIFWVGKILQEIAADTNIMKNGFKIYDPEIPCT